MSIRSPQGWCVSIFASTPCTRASHTMGGHIFENMMYPPVKGVRLLRIGYSNAHGARTVHSLSLVMKWIPDKSVVNQELSLCTRVPRSYDAHHPQDPTVGLCPGPFGGLNGVTH